MEILRRKSNSDCTNLKAWFQAQIYPFELRKPDWLKLQLRKWNWSTQLTSLFVLGHPSWNPGSQGGRREGIMFLRQVAEARNWVTLHDCKKSVPLRWNTRATDPSAKAAAEFGPSETALAECWGKMSAPTKILYWSHRQSMFRWFVLFQ